MCGKDRDILYRNWAELGSPPHVREGPIGRFIDERCIRITPACAGRTFRDLFIGDVY